MTTPQDPKARLAALRAQLAEVEAERDAAKDPEAEIRAAELELANQTALFKAEREFGKLGLHIAGLKTPDGRLVIVKRANHLLFRKWSEEIASADTNKAEELIRPCLVYPTRDAFEAITEEFPGMIGVLANLIAKLAGVGAEQLSGK